jgi:hypothetical protein
MLQTLNVSQLSNLSEAEKAVASALLRPLQEVESIEGRVQEAEQIWAYLCRLNQAYGELKAQGTQVQGTPSLLKFVESGIARPASQELLATG